MIAKLATFQVLNSYVWLEAIVLASKHTELFYYHKKVSPVLVPRNAEIEVEIFFMKETIRRKYNINIFKVLFGNKEKAPK